MGLLDINMTTPEGEGFNSALMAAAQSLLTPRSQGGGMGAAFGAIPQAMDRAKAQAMKESMFGLEKRKLDTDFAYGAEDRAEAQRKRAELQAMIAALPPDQKVLATLNPAKYAESMMPKEHVVPQGAQLVRGSQVLAQTPGKPDAPPEIVRLMQQRDALPEGSPWRAVIDKAINKATTHSPAATAISYGSPVVGVDPATGAPRYYQPSNRGGLEPTGIAPAPAPRVERPMPASVVKDQSDSLEAIGIASGIKSDMAAIRQQLTDKKINLGPVENVASKARNFMGRSTEESRNFATFNATLERMRNQTLILQKGVQTEGDAQRAWNEILANLNDKNLVSQRLAEVEAMNDRAILIHQAKINANREEYGRGPMDTNVVRDLPAAPGSAKPAQPNKRLKFNPATGNLE